MSSKIVDDKSALCISFILRRLETHKKHSTRPLFVGINGIQGSGKTTLVRFPIPWLPPSYSKRNVIHIPASELTWPSLQVNTLRTALTSPPHSHPTVPLSIDDFYLPHSQLLDLRKSHTDNPLLQVRGQPGTHDLGLGGKTFSALRDRKPNVKIPSYDKSAHDGQGDRRPESEWAVVNREGQASVDVVLYEGWCVGFRALEDERLKMSWEEARRREEVYGDLTVAQAMPDKKKNVQEERMAGRLCRQRFENVKTVNDMLKEYALLTE